jgi:hypothetical protein
MICIGGEELFKQSRKLLLWVVQETFGDYVGGGSGAGH